MFHYMLEDGNGKPVKKSETSEPSPWFSRIAAKNFLRDHLNDITWPVTVRVIDDDTGAEVTAEARTVDAWDVDKAD